MDEQNFNTKYQNDHTGAFAEAFFIANLLFVGIFYLLLWGLYFKSYKQTSQVGKNHLKQTLAASSLSLFIVILLNIYVLATTGYASLAGLLAAEIYLMLVVPVFLILGILGFTKAVNEKDFKFPIIGNLLNIKTEK